MYSFWRAKGADSLAELYAKENDIPVEIFLPDWKKYGRAAGPVRNKLIIENAEFVVAFYDDESKGTKNGIDLAKKLNKEILLIMTDEVKPIRKRI